MNTIKPYTIAIVLSLLLLFMSSYGFSDPQAVPPTSEFGILEHQFYNLNNLDQLIDSQIDGTYKEKLQSRLMDDIDRFRNLILLFGEDESSENEGGTISANLGEGVTKIIFCYPPSIRKCGCIGEISCAILESWCAITGGDYAPDDTPLGGGGGECDWSGE